MARPNYERTDAIQGNPLVDSQYQSVMSDSAKRTLVMRSFLSSKGYDLSRMTPEQVESEYTRLTTPPPQPPQLTQTIPDNRPTRIKERQLQNRADQEHESQVVNNGLRLFGYSNLSDHTAALHPELVQQNLQEAKYDIADKAITAAALIPGMQWLRGASPALYNAVNLGLTGLSGYDWYKNGPSVENVSGTLLGGIGLTIPPILNGYKSYHFIQNFNHTKLPKNALYNPEHNIELFYHGSPWRFNRFDASLIGSGEGGTKGGIGVNLTSTPKITLKFANIKSSDAPIHLGRSSTKNPNRINPTAYLVEGRGLNLYLVNSAKGLDIENLFSQGYDGLRLPNQVTIFPQSVNKLSFAPYTIGEFIGRHPNVRFTPFSTEYNLDANIIRPEYGIFKPKITANLQ